MLYHRCVTVPIILSLLFSWSVPVDSADGQTTAPSSGPPTRRLWDAALPTLQLQDVRISGSSLPEILQETGMRYLVRTMLFVTDHTDMNHPFSLERGSCTVRDIFDAICAVYPEMTWTSDAETGVTWFHPTQVPYSAILPQKITVHGNEYGLLMQTEILEPLEAALGPEVIQITRYGTFFTNGFNNPIDVAKAEYTVRDLLNLCVLSEPSLGFFVALYEGKRLSVVSPTSFVPRQPIRGIRPGAMLFWRTEVGPANAQPPSVEELRSRLADRDPAIRRAAYRYYVATNNVYGGPAILSGPMPSEHAVAACLAETSLRVRSPQATHTHAITRLRQELTDEFIERGYPGMAVLGCLELARLTKDPAPLAKLSRRQFAPGQLEEIVPDAYRIARLSPTVRDYLAQKGTAWLAAGAARLADLPNKATSELAFTVIEAPTDGQASQPSP